MAADAFALVRFAVVRPLIESGTVTSEPDRQLRFASAGRRRRGGQAVAPVRGTTRTHDTVPNVVSGGANEPAAVAARSVDSRIR